MPVPRPQVPWAFAHRGGDDGGCPPNSIAAFRDALGRGCQLESDVRLSLDGQPVLIHDLFSWVGRVPVVPRLYRASWSARLGVPRLADVYDALGTDFQFSIDLKEVRAWPATIAVARAAGAVDRLWLVHDDLDLLTRIRAADPDVRLVHEARPQVLARAGLDLATHPRLLAQRGIDAQNTRASKWTEAALACAHEAGVLAFGSMVQTPAAQRAGVSKGLDALYTDHLDGLVAAIAAGGVVVGGAAAVPEPEATAVRGRIDAVLFDFGHTLFSHAPGPEVVRTEAAGRGVALTEAEAAAVWQEIDDAAMDPAEVARGRDLDRAVWAERWSVLYGRADRVVAGLGAAIDRSFHDPAAWQPYADTAEALQRLHEAGVRVGVVSNTGWDVRTPFAARGLDRWVDAFTTSYEVGATKPDPAIFRAACDALGVAPERTWMVGDDRRADGGATAAGLAGVTLVDPATALGAPHGLGAVVDEVLATRR